MGFGKLASPIRLRHVEGVAVIDIYTSISNTQAEFTCSTYSARESKLSQQQKQIIGALSQEIRKER